MTKEIFFDLLTKEVATYKSFLETGSEDWIIKGFIDIDRMSIPLPTTQKLSLKL